MCFKKKLYHTRHVNNMSYVNNMGYVKNASYVNNMSYANNMSYVNNMGYVKLYDLRHELCKVYGYFYESLKIK